MKDIFKNILLVIIVIMIIVLGFIYFKDDKEFVNSISFGTNAISLTDKEIYQLTLNKHLKDVDETIIYASSDEKIATVDDNGLVKGVGAGTALVTATLVADNSVKAEIYVVVTKATKSDKNIAVKELRIDKKTLGIVLNGRVQLKVTVLPTNATNKKITWFSDNPDVATVDNNGVVLAKSVGVATITAKSSNGKTVSSKVSVTKKEVSVDKVLLNKSNLNLKVSDTATLEVTIVPTDATNQNVVWSSTDSSVATVDNKGLVTAQKVGSAVINAKVDGKSVSCNVTVSKKNDTITLTLKEASYTGSEISATVKTQSGIKAALTYYTDSTCTTKTNTTNANSVGGAPKRVGTYYAIASSQGNNLYNAANTGCVKAVVIKNIVVEAVKLNKTSLNIFINKSEKLTATISPSNATNQTLTWTSSDGSVATVSNGTITAKKVGTTTITVETSNGKKATCTVNVKSDTFQNPLKKNDGSVLGGGDPFVTYSNGYYYYLVTSSKDIVISASKNLYEIGMPEKVVTVWKNPYNVVIYAPELHYVRGRWYIYFTNATNNDAETRRMFALRSKTTDPLGEYEYMGKMYNEGHDNCSLDGTIFEWNNELYFVYSARPAANDRSGQKIYISHMTNPYTLDGERILLTKPEYSWEKQNGNIVEGPQVLIKNGVLHIIYSANGAQSESYSLGMLTYNGTGDILSAKSWAKASSPLFKAGNGVYGPGHCSFTKSPDGKEDWIVYHAYSDNNPESFRNWRRNIRIQSFTWNGTTPVFGSPVATGTYIKVPSGSKP